MWFKKNKFSLIKILVFHVLIVSTLSDRTDSILLDRSNWRGIGEQRESTAAVRDADTSSELSARLDLK